MTPLASPRRIAIALLLASCTALVTVTAASLSNGPSGSSSSSSTSALPDAFRVTLPHGGDRLRYTYASQSGGENRTDTATTEWLPETAFRGGDGAWHLVHPVGMMVDAAQAKASTYAGSVQVETAPSAVAWVDVATLRTVASLGGSGASASASSECGIPLLCSDTASAQVYLRTVFPQTAGCDDLDIHLWRGVDPRQPIVLACPSGNTTFQTLGQELLDGIPALHFRAVMETLPGISVQADAWYHADVPGPLRRETHGAVHGREFSQSETLVGFERGTAPWDDGRAVPPAQPLPAIVLADRSPWGPSEEGVAHPFPASQAWALTRDDVQSSTFRDFLTANPDAVAVQSSYDQQTTGDRIERTWTMIVHGAGPDATGRLDATQTTEPVGNAVFAALGLRDPAPPETSYALRFVATGGSSLPYPDPSTLPRQLPTVASAIATWRDFAGDDAGAPGWGLDFGVMDFTPEQVVTVGSNDLASPSSSLLDPAPGQANSKFVVLGLDGMGHILYRDDATAAFREGGSGGPVGTSSIPPREESPVARPALAGIFLPTTPEAAGIGVLSMFVALGYYLWPLAKGGAFGLFSRVQHDRLLDHLMRRRLHDAVEAQPGIHFKALVRDAGAGQGATEHHLRKLVDAGLLAVRAGPGFTCYFPRGHDAGLMAAAPVLKSPGARALLAAIVASPGLSGKDLANTTGLDPSSVTYHVQRMQEAGLVVAHRQGRSLAFEATALASAAA